MLLTALKVSFKNLKHRHHQLLEFWIELQTTIERGALAGEDAQEACPGQEPALAPENLRGI